MNMRSLGDKARQKTDEELADREAQVLLETRVDWEALRPEVHDQETYDRLIEIVNDATENNRDLAQFKSRLKELGTAGISLAKKVVGLMQPGL